MNQIGEKNISRPLWAKFIPFSGKMFKQKSSSLNDRVNDVADFQNQQTAPSGSIVKTNEEGRKQVTPEEKERLKGLMLNYLILKCEENQLKENS